MRRLLIAVLVLLAGASPAHAGESVTFQASPAHDGAVTDEAIAPPLGVKWRHDAGGSISYPIVAGGRVFVTVSVPGGSYGSRIVALDAGTGRVLWERPLEHVYYRSGLAYADGRLFFVDYDGHTGALDPATGEPIWTRDLGNTIDSPPMAATGRLFLSGGGEVRALDAATGADRWARAVANGDHSSPAFDGTRVFVSYAGPQVYAFRADLGTPAWHHDSGSSGGGGRTPAVHAGRVYERVGFGVFDAAGGQRLGEHPSLIPPAFSGGTGVFGDGEALRGVDLASGTTRWTRDGAASAPLIVNGRVYAGVEPSRLVALDLATGNEEWSCSLPGPVEYPDEHNVSGELAGLGAGGGLIVVPAGGSLIALSRDGAGSCASAATDDGGGTVPAGTRFFGGGSQAAKGRSGQAVALRRTGDRVRVRTGLSFACKRISYPNYVLAGRAVVSGEAFVVRGTERMSRRLAVRWSVEGRFTDGRVDGTFRWRTVRRSGGPRGCPRGGSKPVLLRSPGTVAGAPLRPGAGAGFVGTTGQLAGGVRQPVTITVLASGKVVSTWMARLACPNGQLSIVNFSPPARIGADGRFVRKERFRMRYSRLVEHYRVVFRGTFRSDGVTGTVRARLRGSDRRTGRTLGRCDSGPQAFSAVPR